MKRFNNKKAAFGVAAALTLTAMPTLAEDNSQKSFDLVDTLKKLEPDAVGLGPGFGMVPVSLFYRKAGNPFTYGEEGQARWNLKDHLQLTLSGGHFETDSITFTYKSHGHSVTGTGVAKINEDGFHFCVGGRSPWDINQNIYVFGGLDICPSMSTLHEEGNAQLVMPVTTRAGTTTTSARFTVQGDQGYAALVMRANAGIGYNISENTAIEFGLFGEAGPTFGHGHLSPKLTWTDAPTQPNLRAALNQTAAAALNQARVPDPPLELRGGVMIFLVHKFNPLAR